MWEFEAVGLPVLRANLTAMAGELDNPDAYLELLGPEVGADIRRNFEQGGRPKTWPDITAASRAQRKQNPTSGPLIDTETLMLSASDSGGGAEGSLFAVQGNVLTLGTDLPQAATQEYGRGGIPARPYESITTEDALQLGDALQADYLHQMLGGTSVLR